jgi:hypothetical protein
MENKSFDEIMRMIIRSCNNYYSSGTAGEKKTVIECATQIYIAQMKGGEE